MAFVSQTINFENAPLKIIDGDRGKNYPNQTEFKKNGYCLFLNAGNVTVNGFNFSDCMFITYEKDTLLRKGKLIRNDVVLTTRGTVGNAAFYDAKIPFNHIRINSGMVILRVIESEMCPRYLYQFLRSALFCGQVSSLRTGSAQPQLAIRDIYKIKIPLPPLPEQKAIADILSSLDDKIELNNQMNKTLESVARAIFKQWFVDFEFPLPMGEGGPFINRASESIVGVDIKSSFRERDKQDVLVPSADRTSEKRSAVGEGEVTYKSSGGKMVDSELGPIPEGWRVVDLPDIIEVNPTRTLKKDAIASYLEMKNLSETSARVKAWEQRGFTSGTKFINGDVLVARITPCLENGKTAFVDFLNESEVGWGSTEYIVFRSKYPLPVEYTYFLARTEEFRNYAIKNMSGTSGRQRVNTSCFDSYKVVKPDGKIADKFGTLVADLLCKIKHNDEESRILSSLRDTLLPKLMSGELRVPPEKVKEYALRQAQGPHTNLDKNQDPHDEDEHA